MEVYVLLVVVVCYCWLCLLTF